MVQDLIESIRQNLSDGGDGAEGTGLAPPGDGSGQQRDSQKKGDTMPKAWSKKDERKYEHIKESAQERGQSARRAKEMAARTVNRDRRQEGRTPRKTTQGTGKPGKSLDDRSKDELYNIAQDLDIEGRSKMDKRELISAIRKRR